MVQLNITLARFFALSLGFHAAVFAYLTLAHKVAIGPRAEAPPIAVSLLPPREKVLGATAAPAATKAAKTPATVAKKDSKIASRRELAPRLEKPIERGESERATTAEKTARAIAPAPYPERRLEEPFAGLPVPTAPATGCAGKFVRGTTTMARSAGSSSSQRTYPNENKPKRS